MGPSCGPRDLPPVDGIVLSHGPERFPRLDVGLWHLGGARVLGMLVTMDAEQGQALHELVQPRACLPVHHGDFGVFKDPVERFLLRDLPGVRPIGRGETVHLDDVLAG